MQKTEHSTSVLCWKALVENLSWVTSKCHLTKYQSIQIQWHSKSERGSPIKYFYIYPFCILGVLFSYQDKSIGREGTSLNMWHEGATKFLVFVKTKKWKIFRKIFQKFLWFPSSLQGCGNNRYSQGRPILSPPVNIT